MDVASNKIIESLEQCGATFEKLSASDHAGSLREWLEAYKDFHSPERRRLRGVRAVSEAQRVCDGSFLLVPCRNASSKVWSPVGTAYRCQSRQLPDLTESSHYVDTFISPEDFVWTLLYGHEVDVFGGPDFSYRDWHVPVSIERIRKAE